MPKTKRFNKKSAETFEVRQRSERDPRRHTTEDGKADLVLVPTNQQSAASTHALPEEVLPSPLELQKSFDRPYHLQEVDPEVMELLEKDFEDEEGGELDDDFIKLANGDALEGEPLLEDEEGFDEEGDEDEEGFDDDEEEDPERWSKLRNAKDVSEQRLVLEAKFDKTLKGYESEEIGELDEEEEGMAGGLDIGHFNAVLDEFLETQKPRLEEHSEVETHKKAILDRFLTEDPPDEIDTVEVEVEEDEWDCESIISTYSNTDNHPALIAEPKKEKKIKLSKKTGLPLGVLPTKETKSKEGGVNAGMARKGETPEERRQRKKVIKEQNRVKRENKKMLKRAFKEEEMAQQQRTKGGVVLWRD